MMQTSQIQTANPSSFLTSVPPVAIDHVATAFWAIETGNLNLVEVLIGSEIEAENRQYQAALDVIDSYHIQQIHAEYRYSVFKKHCELLKPLADQTALLKIDQIQALHEKFVQSVKEAEEQYLLSYRDRLNARIGFSAKSSHDIRVHTTEEHVEHLIQELAKVLETQRSWFIPPLNEAVSLASLYTQAQYHMGQAEAAAAFYQKQKEEPTMRSFTLEQAANERRKRRTDLIEHYVQYPYLLPEVYQQNLKTLDAIRSVLTSVHVPADTTDGTSKSFLHAAAYYKQFKIANLLIEHGANPAALDNKQRTPADLAGFPNTEEFKAFVKKHKQPPSPVREGINNCLKEYKAKMDKRKDSPRILRSVFAGKFDNREHVVKDIHTYLHQTVGALWDDELVSKVEQVANSIEEGVLWDSELKKKLLEEVRKYRTQHQYGRKACEIITTVWQQMNVQSQEKILQLKNEKEALNQQLKEYELTFQAQEKELRRKDELISINKEEKEKIFLKNQQLEQETKLKDEQLKATTQKNEQLEQKNAALLKIIYETQQDLKQQTQENRENMEKLNVLQHFIVDKLMPGVTPTNSTGTNTPKP